MDESRLNRAYAFIAGEGCTADLAGIKRIERDVARLLATLERVRQHRERAERPQGGAHSR